MSLKASVRHRCKTIAMRDQEQWWRLIIGRRMPCSRLPPPLLPPHPPCKLPISSPGVQIAMKELREKKIPFTIRRFLPDGRWSCPHRVEDGSFRMSCCQKPKTHDLEQKENTEIQIMMSFSFLIFSKLPWKSEGQCQGWGRGAGSKAKAEYHTIYYLHLSRQHCLHW